MKQSAASRESLRLVPFESTFLPVYLLLTTRPNEGNCGFPDAFSGCSKAAVGVPPNSTVNRLSRMRLITRELKTSLDKSIKHGL